MSWPTRVWSVEVAPDQFQSVRAERLQVDTAALIFTRLDGMGGHIVELAFAPGQWLTVSEAQS